MNIIDIDNAEYMAIVQGRKRALILDTINYDIGNGSKLIIRNPDDLELTAVVTYFEPASPLVTSKVVSFRVINSMLRL
jgi:hypothetical protein